MKYLFLLFLLLLLMNQARFSYLINPMAESQKNHSKAYGICLQVHSIGRRGEMTAQLLWR
ncbi:MAG: hypothetical protein Q8862_01690 [Bacteroidota bacterium]|nr:hypothetical protein [Bacteroidota bacterium]MDP4205461.1 hypothetical protein [Bacteroidota bacterium]